MWDFQGEKDQKERHICAAGSVMVWGCYAVNKYKFSFPCRLYGQAGLSVEASSCLKNLADCCVIWELI